MKYIGLCTLLLFVACGEPTTQKTQAVKHFHAPVTGTIIAADSMDIEDGLNKMKYSIAITANDSSDRGYYNLDAAYGFNEAHSMLRYPELDRMIVPAVRRDETKVYSYIIGFYFDGEPEFKDYARVAATQTSIHSWEIELRYLKSYFMDSTGTKKAPSK